MGPVDQYRGATPDLKESPTNSAHLSAEQWAEGAKEIVGTSAAGTGEGDREGARSTQPCAGEKQEPEVGPWEEETAKGDRGTGRHTLVWTQHAGWSDPPRGDTTQLEKCP